MMVDIIRISRCRHNMRLTGNLSASFRGFFVLLSYCVPPLLTTAMSVIRSQLHLAYSTVATKGITDELSGFQCWHCLISASAAFTRLLTVGKQMSLTIELSFYQ
jgi:hypothetical protein